MLEPNVENRSFFNERVAGFWGEGKAKSARLPMGAFVKAVLGIHDPSEAESFLSGHVHWLRSLKPRTIEDAFMIARANISYCLAEEMTEEDVDMWRNLLARVPEPSPPPPPPEPLSTTPQEQTLNESRAAGEPSKVGKDPGLAAALAKKVLQKKMGTK